MCIMPGKRRSRRSTSKRPFWLRIRLVAVSFTLVLIGIGLLLGKAVNKPVCANSISCIKDLSGKYQEGAQEAIFMGRKISIPTYLARNLDDSLPVLGDNTGEKHIYVDLNNQQLHAYQGDKLVLSFPVSTGKWRATPTGDFRIWVKLRYTGMSGGEGADYYNLPNVPYVMFFGNNEYPASMGFSLHGAYWHNNFGHAMSHGCVNIRTEDAAKLFSFADPPTNGYTTHATSDNPGTLVTIFGTAPTD